MTPAELAIVRRAYARQMMVMGGVEDAAVERALASVPREAFLGPPPWILRGFSGPGTTGEADPALVYQDVLVTLDADRGVNNGSPGLHAQLLTALAARPGDSVLHVGAGGGYYTALLAELVGPQGQVTAIEFDARLAESARAHLAPWPQVRVIQGDGDAFPTGPLQRVYVNCAIARPAAAWLDHLAPGGTLVFPLGVAHPEARGDRRFSGRGAALLMTRVANGFAARHLTPTGFVLAEGPLAGTPEQQRRLFEAFERGGVEFVASLRRGGPADGRSWFWSPEWSLSYDEPPEPGATAGLC